MNLLEVRSFAAACMIVAAGHEPKRAKILDDGSTAFYFEEDAQPVYHRFQMAKASLRAMEAGARRTALKLDGGTR
jgi:hypothetical protein